MVTDILAKGIAVVATLGKQDVRVAVAFVHWFGLSGAVMRFARRQRSADW